MALLKSTYNTFVDTSVFGGVFDKEFERDSQEFFRQAEQGRFSLVVSDVVVLELTSAPLNVRDFFAALSKLVTEATLNQEMVSLRDAYISQGVVSKKSEDDAAHIACATVLKLDVIVSWNFKHIVQMDRIRGFNAVNLLHGYSAIEIRSPSEVLSYG